MNENKRLLAVFGVIVAIVLLIILISLWPKPDKSFSCSVKGDEDYKKLGKVDSEQYECLMDLDSTIALVVADGLSTKEKKTLNSVAKDLNRAIYYLDTEEISKADLKDIKKDLSYSDNSFEKDVILAVKAGKVTSYKEEILSDKKALNEFAEEAGLAQFACGVESDAEYENLGEVTYEQYQCLVKSDEPFGLIIARTTCSWCQKFKPVINEYVGNNNLTLYIMETDKWEEADLNALTSSLDYFKDNDSWGTPLTLGIKGGKVTADLSGYTDDESSMDEFFKKANLK